MTIHVVMYSGGIGSWAAAMRARERVAPGDRLVLLFADVKGDSTHPHEGEDEDTYRFIAESAELVGGELIRVADGRTIWEVFRDKRYLGNTRLANCSHLLKQAPARAWLEANTDPADSVIYLGIDWTESHRVGPVENGYQPWLVKFPLLDVPLLDKGAMLAWVKTLGVEPPRAYAQGFPHNNCGGGCVRAGQGTFRVLLDINPERYAHWERKEQELRDHLGKDVAILRDRTGGQTRPMTLAEFRTRGRCGDALDFGGCGCFVDSVAP